MNHSKDVNKFVVAFLSKEHEDLVGDWKSKKNQSALKALFNKARRKDKNFPKRGKSAYLFFCEEHREKVKKSQPDLDAKGVIQELGRQWNELKESKPKQVKKFEKLAAEDKERYERAKAAYVPADGLEMKKGPKRAKSAYLFFCMAERNAVKEENPDMSATEITPGS